MDMKINNREIGASAFPYVIAELSANHGGNLRNALYLLEKVAESGADAFKIQTYTADSMTLNLDTQDFVIADGPWKSRKLYDIYSEGATPYEWVAPLMKEASKLGIALFSTPFDPKSVDLLESLNVCAFKIASFELTFDSLLERIGATGKPVILSTGMATKEEILHALDILTKSGSKSISILKCTTSYPASAKNLNLIAIPEMIKEFSIPVGFSDHTRDSTASIAAVALGASIIEKHIKRDDDDTSLDSSFSMPISEFSGFVSQIRDSFLSRGNPILGATEEEKFYLKYRRSIIARTAIKKGEVFSDLNITVVRPRIGIAPRYLSDVLGKKSERDIAIGEGIAEVDLGNSNER